jgi:hypothetical protein
VLDSLCAERSLVENIGECEHEDIAGPVSRINGLVDWTDFIVNAPTSQCQWALRRKRLSILKAYTTSNETGTDDMMVYHVSELPRQTKEAALSLLVDSRHAVVG